MFDVTVSQGGPAGRALTGFTSPLLPSFSYVNRSIISPFTAHHSGRIKYIYRPKYILKPEKPAKWIFSERVMDV